MDGKQQASEAECAPVMGVISGLLPHTLFTRNEGLTAHKPLNSPRDPRELAETSQPRGQGEFRCMQQASQVRAQWTPHSSRHERRARARAACGWYATSHWLRMSNRRCCARRFIDIPYSWWLRTPNGVKGLRKWWRLDVEGLCFF